MTMRLRIVVPGARLVDRAVGKVTAEAVNGWFCLLPRHVDIVSTLVPGVLVYEDADGNEAFVAIDDAVLVKCGGDVTVATPWAVVGAALGDLQAAVERRFGRLDEHEQRARSAIRKLEATFVRGLMRLEDAGDG